MPSHPSIPPLLSPYISNPSSFSLTLLTSTLGATTNWLVLRFVHAALKGNGLHHDDAASNINEETRVVLVSWLRDATWWGDGGRKLGVDYKKLHVVDALGSGLGFRSGGLLDVEKEILKAIEKAKEASTGEGSVLLVLDGLDFLLAATACRALEAIEMIGEIREVCSTLGLIPYENHLLTPPPLSAR